MLKHRGLSAPPNTKTLPTHGLKVTVTMIRLESLNIRRLSYGSHREFYRALVALVLWASVLYAIAYSPWFIETVVSRIALSFSTVVAFILQSLGGDIERVGTIIKGSGFGIEIYHKCTGVYQAAGFVAGVLAYPTTLRNKFIWVLSGIGFLCALNVIRIVSVFYTGLHFPELVPLLHGVIWEAVMILLTIVIWLTGARRISAARSKAANR